jgi:hypothetical protein
MGQVFGRIPSLLMREADGLVVQDIFGRLGLQAALPGMREILDRWLPDVVLRECRSLSHPGSPLLGRVVDEPVAERVRRRGGPRADAERGEAVRKVSVHGVFTEVQLTSDLAIGEPSGDQPEDLDLTVAEERRPPASNHRAHSGDAVRRSDLLEAGLLEVRSRWRRPMRPPGGLPPGTPAGSWPEACASSASRTASHPCSRFSGSLSSSARARPSQPWATEGPCPNSRESPSQRGRCPSRRERVTRVPVAPVRRFTRRLRHPLIGSGSTRPSSRLAVPTVPRCRLHVGR